MNKFLSVVAGVCALTLAVSCATDPLPQQEKEAGLDVFAKEVPTGYYAVASVTVPLATETVYIEYTDTDGNKNVVEQAVSPKMITPEDGKAAEPFGTVTLLLQSKKPTKVSIYYKPLGVATKAQEEETVPIVDDLPVNMVTSGEFGKTRYVQMAWGYAWTNSESTNWVSTPTFPADVVVYNEEYNHTLLYRYVYSGTRGEGYMLDDAYTIENGVATGVKYHYGSCGDGCQYCMPWGCSCGCGGWDDGKPVLKPNPDFVPNGNKVSEYTAAGASTQAPALPEDVEVVDLGNGVLSEPATYVTKDGDFTMYHSSGVVMFDDTWPELPQVGVDKQYIQDYNDIVIDYDVEAVTVDDSRLAEEGWREQVKVVLHLRALGSVSIYRVGMSLDNFDTQYVQSVTDYKTLDSWQNEHGTLPDWALSNRFQENSIHYDAVSGTEYSRNTLRPAIEIGKLQAFNGEAFQGNTWPGAAGKDVYVYKNGSQEKEHVMNPGLRYWEKWKTPDESQYLPALAQVTEPENLAKMQSRSFYNTIPGFVNVAGGLYTYTVIYHMKPRAEMEPAQREAAKQNMIDAVMNNMAQNFFAVKRNFAPIGLKGYEPLDYKTKDNHIYATEYQKGLASNLDHLNPDVPFVGSNGQIWAFKCPTLTRHTWERMYFSNAYPHFKEWVESGGEAAKDWYKTDVDYTYLTCEW